MKTVLRVGILIAWAASGCHGHTATSAPATGGAHGEAPEAVQVGGANVTVGFALGVRRATRKVEGFAITKHPITVGEYRACVKAGACEEPKGACEARGGLLDHSTYGDENAEEVPVTCVLAAQAQAYCGYVGGRLPTGSEWLLAARGAGVHRYPWGDEGTTCERHPKAEGILAEATSCCGEGECGEKELMAVGKHPGGASPAGVEDLLFARGELVSADEDTACGSQSCLMLARGPAIEGTVPDDDGRLAATFRCVVGGGVR